MIYDKAFGAESWLHWTLVTLKRLFSAASFYFSVEANCMVLCYLPICAWIRCSLQFRRSSASFEFGLLLFPGHFLWYVSCQSFSHFLTQLQGRQSWKFCSLQVHVVQACLLIYLLVSVDISSNKFALKYSIKYLFGEIGICLLRDGL
jgi:hypothetical protein